MQKQLSPLLRQAVISGSSKTVALYGNSYTHYNNNLNTHARSRSLAAARRGKGYAWRGITISSGHLGWHIPNLAFQNNLQPWDTVIFQGNSTETISAKAATRASFTESAIKMAAMAHKANEKVVWFMTWARKDKPEQTEKLKRAYLDIARQTGGYVAPVGLAFAASLQQHPEINLYHSDGNHPSLAGSYLAHACCSPRSTISRRSAVPCPSIAT